VLDKISNRHTRVAVLGNVDAGKSTLIGGLTSDTLDDGRGKSRQTIMKHKVSFWELVKFTLILMSSNNTTQHPIPTPA
jgi:GTPase